MIINLEEERKAKTYKQILDLFKALEEDYLVKINFSLEQLKMLLDALYELYKSKEIIYAYQSDMYTYFYEIICLALEQHETTISYDFLLNALLFCQTLMSPIEISPKDMSKTLLKTKEGIGINGK